MNQTQDAAQEKHSSGSLLEQIIQETNLDPQDEGYEAARLGISAFIEEMLKPSYAGEQVKKITVDRMIAELDRRLSAQTDPEPRKLIDILWLKLFQPHHPSEKASRFFAINPAHAINRQSRNHINQAVIRHVFIPVAGLTQNGELVALVLPRFSALDVLLVVNVQGAL